jgi:hypothetical protein
MAVNSKVNVSQMMGVPDSSIAIIKTINQPYVKQFVVLSRKSTTTIKPNLYTVKIEADTPKLTPTSKIKMSCTCADFRYRLAYCAHEKGALLTSEDFLLKLDGQEVKPDKTNPGCSKFRACKHIKAALKYGLERSL